MVTVKSKIQSFWAWFSAERDRLETEIQTGQTQLAGQSIGQKLIECGLPVMCEVSGGDGSFEIILNPCDNKTDQLTARFWAELAPVLPNWHFSPYRKPRVAEVNRLTDALGREFALDRFRFFVTVSEEEQHYHITVTAPFFTQKDAEEDISLVRLLFYIILGEAATEVYVGELHTQTKPPEKADIPDLDAGQLTAVIAETPGVHAWPLAEDPTGTFFAVPVPEQDDDDLRQDIISGLTRHPQLIANPFTVSDTFRLRGGEFCFLYYAIVAGDPERNFRELITRFFQVAQLLEELHIGYAIGHEIGGDFNYIDLILFDEPVFRSLFHDAEAILGVPVSVGYFSRDSAKVQ